jgi:cysteine desulfurase
MRVFLDHNSGSTPRPEAVEAINCVLAHRHGNPSSIHQAGQSARRALEVARSQVAALIGATSREIVFTSGGTESNNLAIEGVLRSASPRRKVITSAIEHSSVLTPLTILENHGFEIVRIKPDTQGRVSAADIIGSIDDGTALVTLGLVNGEVGTIQSLNGVAERASSVGAAFHVDAAQAVSRIPVEISAIGCDLMTLSAHKLGAPAGSGALFVRDARTIAPVLLGGPQESGRRAGTPNLLGAVAFGAAAEAACLTRRSESERMYAMTTALLSALTSAIPGLTLNGPDAERIPNTLNLTFPGVIGESMLIALDLEGVEVSMGSACAAGAVEPSHVLLAMGRSAAEARSSLRLSLGWNTTEDEIAAVMEIIPRVWHRVAESEPVSVREVIR